MQLPAVSLSPLTPPARRTLTRAAVVGMSLFASLGVGAALGLRNTGMFRPELILAGVLAVGSLPIWLWLRRLEYGILAILLAAGLLNMVTLPTGTQSRLVLSLVIAAGATALWVFKTILHPRGTRLKPSLINAPVLAFAAVGIVSYVWGLVMRDPTVYVWESFPFVQLAALVVNTLLPLLSLFVAQQIEDVRWLKAITWIILGLGGFAVVSFLLDLPTAAAISNGSRGLFATWVGVLALAQLLFNRDLSRLQRILLVALFVAVVYLYFVLYVTWFSGWVPLSIACAVLTFMRSRKLAVAVGLVVAAYLAINATFYFQDLVELKVQSGDLERLSIWEQSLDLVALHPILGMGPAGYAVYNVSYFPRDARSTHNNYFDILAQTGIVGTVVFIWLLVSFVRVGLATRQRLKQGHSGFELAFANATLAGWFGVVVSMLFGDWVLPFAYNQTISGFDNAALTWIMLGGMVSLNLLQSGARRPTAAKRVPWVAS
jgi:hypothetical protein